MTWSRARRAWTCAECTSPDVEIPPPGSPDAIVMGCECDPEPNNGGRMQPEIGWYVFSGCPVHDPLWPEEEP